MLHTLQAADLHRGQEAGTKVGKGLGADPYRDRVDTCQFGADRRQIKRDGPGLLPQQLGDPLHRRLQISQPSSGE